MRFYPIRPHRDVFLASIPRIPIKASFGLTLRLSDIVGLGSLPLLLSSIMLEASPHPISSYVTIKHSFYRLLRPLEDKNWLDYILGCYTHIEIWLAALSAKHCLICETQLPALALSTQQSNISFSIQSCYRHCFGYSRQSKDKSQCRRQMTLKRLTSLGEVISLSKLHWGLERMDRSAVVKIASCPTHQWSCGAEPVWVSRPSQRSSVANCY